MLNGLTFYLLIRLNDVPKFVVLKHFVTRELMTSRQEREIIGFRIFHNEVPGYTNARWYQLRYVHFRVVGYRPVLKKWSYGCYVVTAGHQRL